MPLLNFLANPVVLLIGLFILILAAGIIVIKTTQLRWNIIFLALILAGVLLYIVLSGVNLEDIPLGAWGWLLLLLAVCWGYYFGGLMLASFFLLPLELTAWRRWKDAANTIISFIWGVNYPYYGYNTQANKLEKKFDGKMTRREGGPGLILLRPEHAVVIARSSDVTRIEGEDVIFTRRFEHPLDLFDLRAHVLILLGMEAVTKDGIGITFPIFVPCRIKTAATQDTGRLYTFDPEAVAQVCARQDVSDNKTHPWYDLAIIRAKKVACDVMATYTLDRLMVAKEKKALPRDEARAKIQEQLIAEMADSGIVIPGVGIGNIVPNNESIKEQQIETWAVTLEREMTKTQSKGEGETIQIMEEARAKALVDLIDNVAQGFQEITAKNGKAMPDEVIAFSFISAMEDMMTKQNLPSGSKGIQPETEETIDYLRRSILASGKH